MLINIRENMVLKVFSTTCTDGNTIVEERETTVYICKYIYFVNHIWNSH